MTRKSVMDDIRKENEVHSIRILGSKKDKDEAFYILMNTQQLISDEKEVFHGIKNSTLELLEKAEIKFQKLTHKTESEVKGCGKSFENSMMDCGEKYSDGSSVVCPECADKTGGKK